MKDDAMMDREALDFATEVHGITPQDRVDDAWLRKTFAYQSKRLNLAMRNLGDTVVDAARGSWLGRKLKL